MISLAIDPGNILSAFVLYDSVRGELLDKGKIENETLLRDLHHRTSERALRFDRAQVLVVEMAESFGAKVWSQVFETVFWTGRFVEAWGRDYGRVVRREVKLHLTGSARAKDGQIRQCLIDRWGGPVKALGTKTSRGPLYGVTADVWQALAAVVTYTDRDARS
jgi:hypothetical protein